MKPIKLTMQAFGAYAGKEEVDFEKLDRGLFLVSGPTGSGKTTVFDAIKFALFGEMSGSVRKAKGARSDFASPQTVTFVELLFEHGGKRYRAYRAPGGYRVAGSRKTSSADGLKEAKDECCFECLTDGLSLAGKSKEMTKEVCDLIGIDEDQFGKIVMIAQGEFAQLLNSNTKDRQPILRKVFDTAVFEDAQKALKAREREYADKIQERSRALEAELEGISPSEQSQYLGAWRSLRSQGACASRVGEYAELLGNLVEEDSARLSKGEEELKKAQVECGQFNRELEAARAEQKNRDELEETQAWIKENAPALEQARKDDEEQKALKPQRDKLRAAAAALKGTLPSYEKLDAARKALKDAEAAEKAAAEKEADAERRAGELKLRCEQLEQELAGCGNLEADAKQLASERDALQRRGGQIGELERLLGELDHKQGLLERARECAARATAEREQAEARHSSARTAFYRQSAGILAQGLENGAPCPVCGSREHPSPAALSGDAVTEEQLRALEAAETASRGKEQNAASEAIRLKSSCDAARETLAERARSILGAVADGDLRNALDAAARRAEEDAEELAGREGDHAAKVENRARCAEALELANKQLAAAREAQQQAGEARQAQALEAAGHSSAVKQLGEGLAFACAADAAAELESMERSLQKADRAAQAAGERRQQLEKDLAAKEGVAASLEDKVDYSRDCNPAALEAQVAQLESKVNEWSKGVGALTGRINDYKARLVKIGTIRKEVEKLACEHAVLYDMSTVANADKTGNRASEDRVTFEAYVQAAYFRMVLAAANERLRIMSDMRYELRHRQGSADARSLSGLDIEVLDRNTGVARDTSSLSGGETFLASLSLALGFADVIQAQAGGVSIDAMFIDEGFGSLDDETCATALKVLDRLAEDDRLVGIISHVSQLKERIPRQLIVEKGQSGSHVRLEL